jgi:hypothetical protein
LLAWVITSCRSFDRVVGGQAIGEARRVTHDLAHRRGPRDRLKDRLTLGVDALVDLQILELRHVPGHRLVELPAALLEQDHHRHAGDRLGLAVHPVDRVFLQRRPCGHVRLAVDGLVHDLAVTGDVGDHARHGPRIDQRLHAGVKPGEAFGRKAERLGPGRRGGGLGLRQHGRGDMAGQQRADGQGRQQ